MAFTRVVFWAKAPEIAIKKAKKIEAVIFIVTIQLSVWQLKACLTRNYTSIRQTAHWSDESLIRRFKLLQKAYIVFGEHT